MDIPIAYPVKSFKKRWPRTRICGILLIFTEMLPGDRRQLQRLMGETYAKIFFVLGESHPHYSRNEQFAMDFNQRIKEKYPNLTRGIVRKSKQDGNGVYNQDLSPNSILIEIGGPENTLDELYRTADLLAEIFAEYYWEDAVEVSK